MRPFSTVRLLVTSERFAAPGAGACCVQALDRFVRCRKQTERLDCRLRLRVLPRSSRRSRARSPLRAFELDLPPSTHSRYAHLQCVDGCHRSPATGAPLSATLDIPSESITRHRQSMRGCAPLALRLKALGFSYRRPHLPHSHHDSLFASACAVVHGPSDGCACRRLHRAGTGSR